MRIMDEHSWALKMGKEDGVGVGRLGTWGLRLRSASWVSRRDGSELGKRARFVVAWVKGVGG